MKTKIKHPNFWWKIFHGILIVFAIGFLVMAIIAIIKSSRQICNSEVTKSLLSDYEFWFSGVYACLTLWIISYNLMKFIDVETVKALSDLRSQLNQPGNRAVHSFLLPNDDKRQIIHCSKTMTEVSMANTREDDGKIRNIDIFNYLGTIELGAIMLHRGVIKEDEFLNQFGYRLNNIAANRAIMRHVRKDEQYYKELLSVLHNQEDSEQSDKHK